MSVLEVRLLREGLVESVHYCQAVVCDHRGRLLSRGGEDELRPTFMRSALKPFQALAMLGTGIAEALGLSDPELALLCASHSGDLVHARRVFGLLWRMDLEPKHLACPVPAGRTSPLEHNCSGKHAGMLAACQQRGWSLENYTDRRHPVQQLVSATLAELLGLPADELVIARDDCGAPTYQLTLSQMARLYALLSSGQNPALERLARAMTREPQMVAGQGRLDTVLIEVSEGLLVSKAGAEGVHCIGRIGEGMGLAIKIGDGAQRARAPIVIHLLRELGWIDPDTAEILNEQFSPDNPLHRMEVVGELISARS